jgi:hypothetical protein
VLSRQAHVRRPELSDEALRGLTLDPTAENTLLLYDNPDLGVRFLHPRRWRVAGVRGRQVTLDEAKGSGLLLTLEPLAQVPTAAAYLAESRAWLVQQKAKEFRVESPRRLGSDVEQFAIEAELGGQRVLLDYYVVRQAAAGATLAARLLPEELGKLRREVEQIARSIQVQKP